MAQPGLRRHVSCVPLGSVPRLPPSTATATAAVHPLSGACWCSTQRMPPLLSSCCRRRAPFPMEASAASMRVYEVWRGNNRFFCGGRLMSGPDCSNALFSAGAILLPSLTFCIFLAQDVVRLHAAWSVYAVASLTPLSLLFLALAACSDPGIIPRRQQRRVAPKRVQDVVVDGRSLRLKWCDTCSLFRPPRCSHCSVCDNCCENFDHHCPWVGNCIGKRNYRWFFFFLLSVLLLDVVIFYASVLHVIQRFDILKEGNPLSLILIIYTFVWFGFISGLFFFHIYLLWCGMTTNEKLKQSLNERSSFSSGPLHNFLSLFCTLPSKSHFNRRRRISTSVSSLEAVHPVLSSVVSTEPTQLQTLPSSVDRHLEEPEEVDSIVEGEVGEELHEGEGVQEKVLLSDIEPPPIPGCSRV